MQLLFLARETIATLVKYKCKTFITLTPVHVAVFQIRFGDRDAIKNEKIKIGLDPWVLQSFFIVHPLICGI